MASPLVIVAVHAVIGVVVPPIVFYFFKTSYVFIDVVIAALVAALVQLISLVGGILSMLIMGVLLYWRTKPDLVDAIVAVGASRLAMIGVFLVIRSPS